MRVADDTAKHDEELQCFLCGGSGKLSRQHLLKELGLRHLAEIAQLGIDQTIEKLNKDGFRFLESLKAELEKTYQDRLTEKLQAEHARQALDRESHVTETSKLHEDNRKLAQESEAKKAEISQLQTDLATARATSSKKGEAGEVDFVAFMQQHKDLRIGDKLPKLGDYLLSVQLDQPDGTVRWLTDIAVVDVKKDRPLGAGEMDTLSRDVAQRKLRIGFLVATKFEQLRSKDPVPPLKVRNGVFVVCTLMDDLPTYVDLLRPFLAILSAPEAKTGESEWAAKYNELVGEVTKAVIAVGKIREGTGKIRDQAYAIEKLVEMIKTQLHQYCTTAVAKTA